MRMWRNWKPCTSLVEMLNDLAFLKKILNLAGVAQWTEHQPGNQRVPALNPSQGTCLGCRARPQ